MECKFVVGQKVVCIDDGEWFDTDGNLETTPKPQVGSVYTISNILLVDRDRVFVPKSWSSVFIALKEFQPTHEMYDHTSFKPVDEHKTDISIFQKLLTPASKEVRRVKEHV
jgi:hypothetical protein